MYFDKQDKNFHPQVSTSYQRSNRQPRLLGKCVGQIIYTHYLSQLEQSVGFIGLAALAIFLFCIFLPVYQKQFFSQNRLKISIISKLNHILI